MIKHNSAQKCMTEFTYIHLSSHFTAVLKKQNQGGDKGIQSVLQILEFII